MRGAPQSPKPTKRVKLTNDEPEEQPTTTTIATPSTSNLKLVKRDGQRHTISLPLAMNSNIILGPNFFEVDALQLAPRLLGKLLKRDDVVLQITEVEAYTQNDSASHGRFGITPRTAPIFGRGGHAYVYLCYGLHTMLNIVADKEGVGAGVLIRACAPVCGIETILQRRKQKTLKPVLLSGPGKVGQALGLSTDWSNHPLYTPDHVNALWRFAVAGSPWISAPKNTLQAL